MTHEYYLELQGELHNDQISPEKASAYALLSIAYSLHTIMRCYESTITDDGCVAVMPFPPLEHLLKNMGYGQTQTRKRNSEGAGR